ncbi:MAG: hypothetical protein Q4D77_04840 [Peptostreptococcaceae bacterium]|nr:hypothetical protein [Peptostreptococcaceae bacterium]
MKRTTAWIMTGLVVSGMVMGYSMIKSDASQKVEAIPYEDQIQTTDIKSGYITPIGRIADGSIRLPLTEDEIRSFDFLTAKEKEQLIQAEKKAAPHYKKIREIDEKIEQISQKIEDKYIKTMEEYEKLMSENDDLWIKISNKETQEAINDVDNRTLIKRATDLTEQEKQKLLKVEDRLDELNAELDKMYDEIDQATKDLNKQLDGYYAKVDEIMKKNNAIWEKLHKSAEPSSLGKDVILY